MKTIFYGNIVFKKVINIQLYCRLWSQHSKDCLRQTLLYGIRPCRNPSLHDHVSKCWWKTQYICDLYSEKYQKVFQVQENRGLSNGRFIYHSKSVVLDFNNRNVAVFWTRELVHRWLRVLLLYYTHDHRVRGLRRYAEG